MEILYLLGILLVASTISFGVKWLITRAYQTDRL